MFELTLPLLSFKRFYLISHMFSKQTPCSAFWMWHIPVSVLFCFSPQLGSERRPLLHKAGELNFKIPRDNNCANARLPYQDPVCPLLHHQLPSLRLCKISPLPKGTLLVCQSTALAHREYMEVSAFQGVKFVPRLFIFRLQGLLTPLPLFSTLVSKLVSDFCLSSCLL